VKKEWEELNQNQFFPFGLAPNIHQLLFLINFGVPVLTVLYTTGAYIEDCKTSRLWCKIGLGMLQFFKNPLLSAQISYKIKIVHHQKQLNPENMRLCHDS
jgi:hypothetical protein